MRAIPRSLPAIAAVAGLVLATGACSSSTNTASSGSATSQAPTTAGTPTTTPPTSASASAPTTATATGAGGGAGTTTTVAATSTGTSSNYPVDLQPSTAAPGQTVMVYGLTCSSDTGTATSSAFTRKVALSMISNATGGSATVKSGLASGKYTVTVSCGSITAKGTLTVR